MCAFFWRGESKILDESANGSSMALFSLEEAVYAARLRETGALRTGVPRRVLPVVATTNLRARKPGQPCEASTSNGSMF